MFKNSPKSLLLLIVILAFGNRIVLAIDQPHVLLPSELQPPCTLVNAVVFMDDYDSGHFTLADQNGKLLTFSDGYDGDYFYLQNGTTITKVKSAAGNAEEQILLKILKDWYSKNDAPSLDTRKEDFGPNEGETKSRYWNDFYIKHFIHVLERRCKTKMERPPGW